MDQKRAMLYPPIEPGSNSLARDQRMSASVAIGLPTEAPPSYDMAMSSPSAAPSTSIGWRPSAPAANMPDMIPNVAQSTAIRSYDEHTAPVIVQQPQSPQNQPQTSPNLPYQQQLPADPGCSPPKLGPNPCAVTCPACGACKTTRMCYTPNSRTHLCALLLCLVGWCCCACWVPYCMNSCRTGNHYCSKCNTFLGAYNPRTSK